jgi:hypothetical protein
MYHMPVGKIMPILTKYSMYLKKSGVFIVRMYTINNGEVRSRPAKMIQIITDSFEVVEKNKYGEKGATVIVFRPKSTSTKY